MVEHLEHYGRPLPVSTRGLGAIGSYRGSLLALNVLRISNWDINSYIGQRCYGHCAESSASTATATARSRYTAHKNTDIGAGLHAVLLLRRTACWD